MGVGEGGAEREKQAAFGAKISMRGLMPLSDHDVSQRQILSLTEPHRYPLSSLILTTLYNI